MNNKLSGIPSIYDATLSEDLIHSFSSHVRHLGVTVYGRLLPIDVDVARAGLESLSRTYPHFCDIWLALAQSGQDVVHLIEPLYHSRNNLGILQQACELEPALYFSYYSGLYLSFTASQANDVALAYCAYLIDQGDFQQACEILDELYEEYPHWLELLWMKIVLNYTTSRWTEIIKILTPLKEHLDDFDPYFRQAFTVVLGISFAKLGIHSPASKFLEQGKGPIEDASFDAQYAQAMVLRAMDKREEAQQLLVDLLSVEPHNKEISKAIADESVGLSCTTAEKIEARTDIWDIRTEPDDKKLERESRAESREKLLEAAENDLNKFVGITEVKDQVQRLKSSVAMSLLRQKRGLGVSNRTHHLVFAGPPGTGKTTIARVISKIYCGLGIISNDNVTEVVRSDLVGQHIGETEAKTNAVIDRAMDGVMFLDEAYSLVSTGSKNDFGLVAVDTLLARMENDRDRLIVIIAGYEEDLQNFLNANEGLRSRFSRTIYFHSYTPEELLEMAILLAKSRDSIIESKAHGKLLRVFKHLSELTSTDEEDKERIALDIAGNGRFVRNMVERAEENREYRLNKITDHDSINDEQLMTITADDVEHAAQTLLNSLGLPSL